MSRRLPMAAFVAVVVSGWVCPALAQRSASRLSPRGVTGLEMGIEGSLDTLRGGQLRWFVSVYDVLGRRDLRPASDAQLEVTASHAPAEVLVRAQTDANGHAALVIPMPSTLEDVREPPELRVTVSHGAVRRVFAVQLRRAHRYRARLFVDRSQVAPGASVTAFGQLVDRVTGRPAEGVEVRLTASEERVPVLTEELTTGPAGTFLWEVTHASEGHLRLRVGGQDVESDERWVAFEEDRMASMWVEVTPERAAVPVGERVVLDVRVRDRSGRALAGARVESAAVEEPVSTGDDGRARLSWVRGQTESEWSRVQVTHPAFGLSRHPVRVRLPRSPFQVAASVGPGLVPELAARVPLRLTDSRGRPAAGMDVHVEAPRLGVSATQRPDSNGFVVLEGRLGAPEANDPCGGPAAFAVRVTAREHTERVCVPVDVNATVALEAPLVVRDSVPVGVQRRRAVAGRPVEVVALLRDGSRWVPVARTTLAGSEPRGVLELPPSLPTALWLRARPLLAEGRAVRGGGRLAWRAPADPFDAVGADATGTEPSAVPSFGFVVEHGVPGLLRDVREETPFAEALSRGDSGPAFEAVLAEHTPVDAAASLVLEEGEVSALPMPLSPIDFGLLRAPWRTRSRFVRGRVGHMLRAVEAHVEARLPDLTECAVREGGRWRFNHSILESALRESNLTDERATALDGERLDLPGLMAMAPGFTFDHVAARLTRVRLLRLLRLLRELVRERDLDLPWSRDGEVEHTLLSLLDDQDLLDEDRMFVRELLYDGWGRPFVLRRRRGAAAHVLLDALPGWTLASAGADGRAGTRDDLVDPFRRVLPEGVYADAVGEQELVQRLEGVVAGRVSIAALAEAMAVRPPPRIRSDEGARPPGPRRDSDRPRLRRPSLRRSIGGRISAEGMRWQGLSPERRRYRAVTVSFGQSGGWRFQTRAFEAGTPWTAEAEMPSTMRPGEVLRVPVRSIQLASGPAPSLRVEASAGLAASIDGGAVRLEATRPGRHRLTLEVVSAPETVTRLEYTVRVVPHGALRARYAGTLVRQTHAFEPSVPDDARAWRSRLVIGAPGALSADPSLAAERSRHPAIFAWSEALAGGPVDAALFDAIGRQRRNGLSPLGTACALAASAADPDTPDTTELRNALEHSLSEGLAARADVLAALAGTVPAEPPEQGVSEVHGPRHRHRAGVGALMEELRQSGWRALALRDGAPAVMARLAAALLLVDPADASGAALFERVVHGLEADASGRRWVRGEATRPGDSWIGTVALAVAARQLGRDDLARELSGHAIARLYMAARAGEEGVFWALAAGRFGALGIGAPEAVEVVLDGRRQPVAFEHGVAELPIDGVRRVAVNTDSPVYARTELRYLRPWETREASPITVALEGVAGRLGDTAGFEIVVDNRGEHPLASPVLEVGLPGAAMLGEAAREVLSEAPVRAFSEPDGAGVIRLRLAAIEAHETVRIPLPVRWLASGTTVGLGLSVSDASTPWRATRVAPRRIDIEERSER